MSAFIIDADSNITAFDGMDQVRASNPPAGSTTITAKTELFRAYAKRPTSDLIDLWNSFAGTPGFDDLKPVKKFTDRNTGVDRIWKAMQRLAGEKAVPIASPGSVPELPEAAALEASAPAVEQIAGLKVSGKKAARKASAAARKAHAAPKASKAIRDATAPKPAKEGSRTATVLAMITRKNGATLQELMDATGWQAHSVRGFISTLGKKGLANITSTRREDGARLYQADKQ